MYDKVEERHDNLQVIWKQCSRIWSKTGRMEEKKYIEKKKKTKPDLIICNLARPNHSHNCIPNGFPGRSLNTRNIKILSQYIRHLFPVV